MLGSDYKSLVLVAAPSLCWCKASIHNPKGGDMLIEIVGTDVIVDGVVYTCESVDEAIALVVWLDTIN